MSNTTSSIKKIPLTYKGIFYMNMIEVPAGSFLLGGEKEIVFENPFYMAEFPVTQELYEAVMGINPSEFKGKRRPVEMVSWHDAQNFIKKLNQENKAAFRLPSEAEWEYAARGGKQNQDFEYSGGSILDTLGWYIYNSYQQKTRPVGLKMPNELGLYDMSGNVWEWCEDWYDDYSKKPKNGSAYTENGSGRVFRGGSWAAIRSIAVLRIATTLRLILVTIILASAFVLFPSQLVSRLPRPLLKEGRKAHFL